jgi:hypothetical protein
LTCPHNQRIVTQTDIEVLREAYREFNAGVIRDDLLVEDFVLEQTLEILDSRRTFRGRGALEASLRELQSGFDAVHVEPLEFDVRDDWIVATVLFEASTRGIEQKIKIVHLWKMRDGLLAHMRVVGASEDADAQLAQLRDD